MDREILFRGRALRNTFSISEEEARIKKGDWIYGDLIHFDDGIDLIYERDPNNSEICGCTGIEVDHKTVGQYTGIDDNNGVKIFEGDIIRFKYEDYSEYNINGYHHPVEIISAVTFEYGEYRIDGYPCRLGSCLDYGDECEFEVIGNIYDKSK